MNTNDVPISATGDVCEFLFKLVYQLFRAWRYCLAPFILIFIFLTDNAVANVTFEMINILTVKLLGFDGRMGDILTDV